MHRRIIIQLILALGLLTSGTSLAQGTGTLESEESAIGRTPPRLSSTWGEVSFWRQGAQDWSQAQANTPLAPGDLLYTGPRGNLEIQIGSGAFVRGGPNTQLGLENQEPDFLQFKVTAGNASFDLRTIETGRTVEVNTPNAVFTIENAGYYRVDVTDESTSFIARRGGQATASYPGGEAVAIEPSEDIVIEGTEGPRVTSYVAPQLDEWDRWNYTRTDRLLDAVSARYVSPGVYGVDDLDVYGTWRIVPDYGAVWVPRGVSSGWVPYSTGAWVHDPYYGWTWVDTAPWGWAPYHYGRWVFANGFWAWAPGPVVVRPAYAPALVAFFGGPSAGVTVGVGTEVGWVALGWGEPCIPWWGSERFRQRPWWGGWGGPRVVDNVVIRNTTVVNVQEIRVYRNVRVRNAVVVVREDHFGRGLITSARVTKVNVKDFRPIHHAPAVTPTHASFVPKEKRGVRPPEKILQRSVVATRPPQTHPAPATERVQGAGPERVPAPAPRMVSPPQHRETSPALHRPPYGQRGVERSTERTRPTAPPKMEVPRGPERTPKGAAPVTPKVGPPQRGSQPARPSRVEPQPSGGRAEPGRAQPAVPPGLEGRRGYEQGPKRPASVTPKAGPPQREAQPARPSMAEPQPSGGRAEPGRAQPAVPPGAERPRGSERAPKGPPTVAPQAAPAPSPQQRGSHVASPPPAESRPPARGSESAHQPSRVLPGEPANRLSPNPSERKAQQPAEHGRKPERSVPPRGAPEDAPRGSQSD
jgi:hypothetical protein